MFVITFIYFVVFLSPFFFGAAWMQLEHFTHFSLFSLFAYYFFLYILDGYYTILVLFNPLLVLVALICIFF